MENYKLVDTAKNTEVISIRTLKVLKTIPMSYKGDKKEFVEKWYSKMTFNKSFYLVLKKIKKKEPYVFELINKMEIKGARVVEIKEGFRFELVYVNGVRIKINEILYNLSENKLPSVFLNY